MFVADAWKFGHSQSRANANNVVHPEPRPALSRSPLWDPHYATGTEYKESTYICLCVSATQTLYELAFLP